MDQEELMQHWQQRSQEAAQAMREWRERHPKATLAEIESAVDEQMNQLRARMIEEVVQTHPDEQAEKKQKDLSCPHCGGRLQARGKHQRKLQTHGGQMVTLTRQYHSCPLCGYSFFPPR